MVEGFISLMNVSSCAFARVVLVRTFGQTYVAVIIRRFRVHQIYGVEPRQVRERKRVSDICVHRGEIQNTRFRWDALNWVADVRCDPRLRRLSGVKFRTRRFVSNAHDGREATAREEGKQQERVYDPHTDHTESSARSNSFARSGTHYQQRSNDNQRPSATPWGDVPLSPVFLCFVFVFVFGFPSSKERNLPYLFLKMPWF